MARFKAGDSVRILSTVTTPFAGLDGLIDEVKPHDRGVGALDQYVVVFSWGERSTFYDVQLQTALSERKKRKAA